MKRPDISFIKDEKVLSYIEYLECLKEDNIYLLYDSMRKKIKELADAIDDTVIDLNEASDKSFDRLVKAMTESKTIAENMKFFRDELGFNLDESVDSKSSSPIEIRAKKKANNG